MAKNKQPKDKEESLMEAVIMVIIAFVVLFALVWVIASNKIAYYSAPGLWYMGYPWSFINADKWNVINEGYMYIRQNPRKIGFTYYMQFANLCLRPLAAMFGLVTTAYIASLFFGKDKGGGSSGPCLRCRQPRKFPDYSRPSSPFYTLDPCS